MILLFKCEHNLQQVVLFHLKQPLQTTNKIAPIVCETVQLNRY